MIQLENLTILGETLYRVRGNAVLNKYRSQERAKRHLLCEWLFTPHENAPGA